jgi:hypothetical protein
LAAVAALKSFRQCTQFIFYIHRWTYKVFREGFRKDLEIEDMYGVLEEHQSDLLGNELER